MANANYPVNSAGSAAFLTPFRHLFSHFSSRSAAQTESFNLQLLPSSPASSQRCGDATWFVSSSPA